MKKKLLFRMDGVPEDEAEEVRELLLAHGVEYYETPAGKWGVSVGAIWVADEATFEQAKPLLERYGEERARQAREDYQRRLAAGEAETLLDRLKSRPLHFVGYLALAVGILYFSIMPFLWLRDG